MKVKILKSNKMKTNYCIYCGKPIKSGKNHCLCFGCKCATMFMSKPGTTAKTKTEKAIKHLQKKPGLLKQIFGF